MATALSICNTALLLANANIINSFDDSTREAAMCDALYETTKDAVLAKFSWSFSIFQETLAKTTNTPLDDWTYEYQLPTGYLRVLKKDTLQNDYRIYKDKLLSNDDGVVLTYQKDPGVSFYPAYFVRLLEYKMAELLSKALVQDENMAKIYQQDYLIAMREARGIDSQNNPNRVISENEFSLTAVRGLDG